MRRANFSGGDEIDEHVARLDFGIARRIRAGKIVRRLALSPKELADDQPRPPAIGFRVEHPVAINPGGEPMTTEELFAQHDPTLTWDDLAEFADAAGMSTLSTPASSVRTVMCWPCVNS